MFATTPSLRDRIDLRKAALIAVLASAAFGLQVAFLAGVVASPLGGAIADLDRIPAVQGMPDQALAAADAPVQRGPELARVAQVRARPAAASAKHHRAASTECPNVAAAE